MTFLVAFCCCCCSVAVVLCLFFPFWIVQCNYASIATDKILNQIFFMLVILLLYIWFTYLQHAVRLLYVTYSRFPEIYHDMVENKAASVYRRNTLSHRLLK